MIIRVGSSNSKVNMRGKHFTIYVSYACVPGHLLTPEDHYLSNFLFLILNFKKCNLSQNTTFQYNQYQCEFSKNFKQ